MWRMIISIEGLPGCLSQELYQKLCQSGVNIKRCSVRDDLFWKNPSKYGLCNQLDWLSKLSLQYEEPGDCYESVYARRELYPKFYSHKNLTTGDEYETHILNRYYDLQYRGPDVVIYLYGDLETCYESTADDPHRLSFENYKELYYQYEWTFDVTNCKIPMWKVTVDDDPDSIVANILDILKRISNANANANANANSKT